MKQTVKDKAMGYYLRQLYEDKDEFTTAELRDIAVTAKISSFDPSTSEVFEKIGHGTWQFTGLQKLAKAKPVVEQPVDNVVDIEQARRSRLANSQNLIPTENDEFVPFGIYGDLKKVIKRDIFFPVIIVGETGNGKTEAVHQACATSGKKMIQVNFTSETDEEDLMGSFQLVNGNTIFQDGPVITAMREGALLLLDEIDYGSPNKISCLQEVLQGRPYFNKKTGELVKPEKGFTIVATANTKGKGDETGKYIGTQILNEAFLERFRITFEQAYPTETTEHQILVKHAKKYDVDDAEFVRWLCAWAKIVRSTYDQDGIDENITTRRLLYIIEIYSIFNNKRKALEYGIARFDSDTKEALIKLYEQLHEIDGGSIEGEEQKDNKPVTFGPNKPNTFVSGTMNYLIQTLVSNGQDHDFIRQAVSEFLQSKITTEDPTALGIEIYDYDSIDQIFKVKFNQYTEGIIKERDLAIQ